MSGDERGKYEKGLAEVSEMGGCPDRPLTRARLALPSQTRPPPLSFPHYLPAHPAALSLPTITFMPASDLADEHSFDSVTREADGDHARPGPASSP